MALTLRGKTIGRREEEEQQQERTNKLTLRGTSIKRDVQAEAKAEKDRAAANREYQAGIRAVGSRSRVNPETRYQETMAAGVQQRELDSAFRAEAERQAQAAEQARVEDMAARRNYAAQQQNMGRTRAQQEAADRAYQDALAELNLGWIRSEPEDPAQTAAVERLRQESERAGEAVRQAEQRAGYPSGLGDRLRGMGASAAQSYGAGMVNAVGALDEAAGVGNELRRKAEEKQRAAFGGGFWGTLVNMASRPSTGNAGLDMINRNLQEMNGEAAPQLYETADTLQDKAAENMEYAQRGAGTVGSLLLQAGAAGLQMGADVAIGLATGGTAMAPMLVRSFGGGAQEARQKGYSLGQQVALGFASAATEYLTERLFGGNPAYDADVGIVNRLVGKLTSNEKVLGLLESLPVEMLNEGLEEVLSYFGGLLSEGVITGNWDAVDWDEAVEEGAVGALMGVLGQGGQALIERAGAANTRARELRELGAAESPENRAGRAGEPETGRDTAESVEAAQAADLAAERAENEARRETEAPERETAEEWEETAEAEREIVQESRELVQESREPVEAERKADFEAREAAAEERQSAEDGTAMVLAYASDRNTEGKIELARAMLDWYYGGDAVEYISSMERAYEAGRRGDETELQGAERAAWNAGRIDGLVAEDRNGQEAGTQTSMENGREDAGESAEMPAENLDTSANIEEKQEKPDKKPGLVRDNYTSAMDTREAERIDRVAKLLGVSVELVDSVTTAGGEEANADISGNLIRVERGNPNPLLYLLGHEWTHRVQEAAPEQYRAFRDAISGEIAEEAAATKKIYTEKGLGITEDQALDEAAANYAGRMLEDGRILDDFIAAHKNEKSLLQRLWEAVRGIARKLTGAERRMAQTAEGKLRAALDAAARAAKEQKQSTEYSIKGTERAADIAAMEREIRQLRERAEYLQKQMRTTTEKSLRDEDVKRLARETVQKFGSRIKPKEIQEDLKRVGNALRFGGMSVEQAKKELLQGVARQIVEEAVETVEGAEVYDELRKKLKEPMTISQRDAADVSPEWYKWRNQNRGLVNVSINGKGPKVDQVYSELSAEYPEYLPEGITRPADMLLQMAEVASAITPSQINPFAGAMDEAAEHVANSLVESLLSDGVRETPKTWADRLQESYRKSIERAEREHREQMQAIEERWKRQNTRKQIDRLVNSMSRRLIHPSNNQYIREELRGPVANVLKAINLESGFEWIYGRDAKYKRVRRGTAIGGEPASRTKAMQQLRAALEKVEGEMSFDPDLLGDEETQGLLDMVIGMADKRVDSMTDVEQRVVLRALEAVDRAVKDADKLFHAERDAKLSQKADVLRAENSSKKEKQRRAGVLGKVQRMVDLDTVTPEAYFHQLGSVGDMLFRELRDAQDRQTLILDEAIDYTKKTIGKYDVDKAEKTVREVTLGGEKIRVTVAQLMDLYNHMVRQQSMDHALQGGVMPERVQVRGKDVTRSRAVRGITIEEIQAAVDTLTDEEKRIARALQGFASGRGAAIGNEATMEVYGYKKFGLDGPYWPIKVSRSELKSTAESTSKVRSVANWGAARYTVPNADQALVLRSVFDTFSEHITGMARYASHLAAIEDVQRMLNYQYNDHQGTRLGTVKEILTQVHGQGGTAYLEKLLQDLSVGVQSQNRGAEYMGRLTGNFKTAAIAGNLRVLVQQPTAILRAAEMINPIYLAGGLTAGGEKAGIPVAEAVKGWRKAVKYAPIAKWKDWGYYDIGTGRSVKSLMFRTGGVVEKTNAALMALPGAADALAWGQLWNAVEMETKARRKNLAPGSQEYYDAVSRRFSEIVDRTQVVDGILQRSQIMRETDGIAKAAISFMAEPTKQYNELRTAVYDVIYARKGSQERANARKHLARTAITLVAAGAANAAAQSLVDAMRSGDRDRDYWERWAAAYLGIKGDEQTLRERVTAIANGNLAQAYNPLSYFPFARDIQSIISGYSVDRMDMEIISDLLSAGQDLVKSLRGESKKSTANAVSIAAAQTARLLGIPLANIRRDVLAIINSYATEKNNYLMQYGIDKALYDVKNEKNRSIFVSDLFRAYQNDRQQYELMLDMMVRDGFERDKIRESMENQLKKAQGVTKAEELDQRYLLPDEQREYDATLGKMRESKVWERSTKENRDTALASLYDLAVDNKTGQELEAKLREHGISESDYLLYRVALSMTDQPNENGKTGTYTRAEKEAAAAMVQGLDIDKLW